MPLVINNPKSIIMLSAHIITFIISNQSHETVSRSSQAYPKKWK